MVSFRRVSKSMGGKTMNVDVKDVVALLQSHVDEEDRRALGLTNGLKYAIRLIKENYGIEKRS